MKTSRTSVIALRSMKLVSALVLVGCAARTQVATTSLREACPVNQHWDGSACVPRGESAAKIAAGKAALAKQDVDLAKAAFDAVAGPLDYSSNVTLWEQ